MTYAKGVIDRSGLGGFAECQGCGAFRDALLLDEDRRCPKCTPDGERRMELVDAFEQHLVMIEGDIARMIENIGPHRDRLGPENRALIDALSVARDAIRGRIAL